MQCFQSRTLSRGRRNTLFQICKPKSLSPHEVAIDCHRNRHSGGPSDLVVYGGAGIPQETAVVYLKGLLSRQQNLFGILTAMAVSRGRSQFHSALHSGPEVQQTQIDGRSCERATCEGQARVQQFGALFYPCVFGFTSRYFHTPESTQA